MSDFRQLKVWHKAHALALAVYRETEAFPRSEHYGLTQQLRQAASSIPSNLAEGCGRDSDAELVQYAKYSLGSANEVDYQLLLARDLGYLRPDRHAALAADVQEVRRMLAALRAALNRQRPKKRTTDD